MAHFSSTSDSSKRARVAVVGAGVVSPLGFGMEETLRSLREAKDCVTAVTAFPTDRCRCKTAGQVANETLAGANKFNPHPERLHRVARMMILALKEALEQAGDFRPELSVVGTTSGGMTFGEQYYRRLTDNSRSSRHAPTLIANYTPQKPLMDAQEAFGIRAPCQIIANACASGTNAIGHAFNCIRSGRYQRILAGGYDAISELVFVGFDSLQAATPDRCRPFDRERSGLVLGEGAAILALENFESAQKRGATVLAEIIGYGISTDNFHLTQPDPSGVGPRQAMESALQSAQIEASEINYINAHGTATPFNDASEGKAIAELFNGVPISSTKGLMGHSLGAAGAIEAAITLIALQHQLLPPNIHFRAGDPGLDLNIVANESRTAAVRTAISNSFGFGGTNASVIIRSHAA
ncbi:MAG: beta-ketoacyl-[acyl-carrier-protein] synthase family protein [Chthoniobacterales bacterium]